MRYEGWSLIRFLHVRHPTDRVESQEMKPGRRRVVESHGLARSAFRLAGVFGGVALIWSVVVLVRGGSWWGPLHAFLAGTVLLAISGASQLFTITWAAARAPSRSLTSAQRWSAAAGVVAVLVGVTESLPWLVWVGGTGVVASLALLSWSIRSAVRRSLLRRFDLSSRFYLVAFAVAVVGVTLGMVLGSGQAGTAYADLRAVHAHLNLAGFVGLTIIGTLPTFLATVSHHRAVSGLEASVGWWACLSGVAVIAAGTVGGQRLVGAGTLLVSLGGAAVLGGIVLRLGDRGHSKPTFVQITAGTVWLLAWGAVDGLTLLSGGTAGPFGLWTAAVVVAGVGQVLAGSLGYLLPVLAGPPLGANAERMSRRPTLALVVANLAGVAFVAGVEPLAWAAVGVWLIDFSVKVAGIRSRREVT